jgi:O-antigen/teichoic acid export membrane protein
MTLAWVGSDVISLWMGPEFAVLGGTVLRILAVGALLNSVSYVPYAALIAFGRPDLPAKFHLAELPLYLLLSLWLIPRWGIAGAAVAVSVRLTVDAIALLWAAARYVDCSASYGRVHRVIVLNCVLVVAFLLARNWADSATVRLAGAALCILGYAVAGWFFVLGESERPLFLRILQLGGRAA